MLMHNFVCQVYIEGYICVYSDWFILIDKGYYYFITEIILQSLHMQRKKCYKRNTYNKLHKNALCKLL